jgi:hypothetical protein
LVESRKAIEGLAIYPKIRSIPHKTIKSDPILTELITPADFDVGDGEEVDDEDVADDAVEEDKVPP